MESFHLHDTAFVAAVVLTQATPTPPPGPLCHGPEANNSGLIVDCVPESLLVHDSSCANSGAGESWVIKPNFHPSDKCHGLNDPNGVMWYNGVYHLFYQDHVGGGTVGGHMASKDLVHWRRLPVGLWNDQWYDKSAVWTFSATIVNGVPTLIYPGIATPNSTITDCEPNCFTHAVALPVDVTDPWLVDWYKPNYNPIAMGTQRDPSTAWRTSFGEWRFTNVLREVFTSHDFKTWRSAGIQESFGGGECPDFYPLPPVCKGCSAPSDSGPQPTHVHQNSGYQLGIYNEGLPGSAGNFTELATGGVDGWGYHYFYASKSFWDPTQDRRVQWGWIRTNEWLPKASGYHGGQCPGLGKIMTNSLTAREITYDPQLNALLFSPLPEMTTAQHATPAVAMFGPRALSGRVELVASGAKQVDLRASFEVPSKATRLGFSVMTGTSGGQPFGTDIYVDFVPAGLGEQIWQVHSYINSSSMQCPDAKDQSATKPCPSRKGNLMLKATDKTIDFTILVDNTFVEVFLMGGRAPTTVPLPCQAIAGQAGLSMFAGDAQLISAEVWHIKPLDYEEVDETSSSMAV